MLGFGVIWVEYLPQCMLLVGQLGLVRQVFVQLDHGFSASKT